MALTRMALPNGTKLRQINRNTNAEFRLNFGLNAEINGLIIKALPLSTFGIPQTPERLRLVLLATSCNS